MVAYIKRLIKFLYHKIKNRHLVKFYFSSQISKKALFEGANKVYPNAYFEGYLGYGSYIGPNASISAKIGRFTSIAPFVKVINGTHPITPPNVSTSPMFYSLRKQNGKTFTKIQRFNEFLFYKETNYPVVIENDCWIGERAMIIGGVKIFNGAVILAGSIVTKDVPPYAVVGGIPAKIIRYRFDDETIKFLLNFKWWDKNEDWLKKNIDLLNNIDLLKKI